jgi:hypothetical protein
MGLRRVGDRPVDRVFVEPVLGAHTPEVESTEGGFTEGGSPEGGSPEGSSSLGGPPFSFDGVETLD